MALARKLGIALGGGSARGWAHIGVLRALTEEGIKPDLIAGCSIGALVGAAFAAGRLDELEAWARGLDWKRMLRLLDFGSRGGLIKGGRMIRFIREQLVESAFSDLPVKLAIVATDLASGQEIWLRDGSVSDAIGASIAIPGLFQPVLHEGHFLIDGGVVNPVPVSLCRAMGAGVIIAVDLSSDLIGRFSRNDQGPPNSRAIRPGLLDRLLPRRRQTLEAPGASKVPSPSLLESLLGAIDIMQVKIARSRLAGEPPDVLLTPRLGHLGVLDFHRAEFAIAEGRDAVVRMLPAIRSAIPAAG